MYYFIVLYTHLHDYIIFTQINQIQKSQYLKK